MRIAVFLSAILLLLLAAAPVTAVLQEITYHGTVVSLDPANNSIEINVTNQFGCVFGNGSVNCTWDAINPARLNGTVPDPSVFSVFSVGDHVEATSMGGAGGTWIAIARIFPTPGIENWYATDIIGDPAVITARLVGDYQVFYYTLPDCKACTGTVCTAAMANVSISSIEGQEYKQALLPGQNLTYSARNDNSSVMVAFVHGQASADLCPNSTPMTGLQPISDFIIHANPPLASATSQTSIPGTVTSPVPTTKASLGPMSITAAFCLACITLVVIKRR